MIEHQVTVTVDGPAGAGKSTASKALARRLGYTLLDTGAIYRAVAFQARRGGVALDDAQGLRSVAEALHIRFRWDGEVHCVFVDGEDVSAALRTPENSQAASVVSALPEVRAALLGLQRRLAGDGGTVLEGRDTGTVVVPDAEVKFFLTASDEVRAKRRCDELRAKGIAADLDEVLREQRERDRRDSERSTAPLRCPEDAVVVNSSDLSLDQVVSIMEEAVRSRTA